MKFTTLIPYLTATLLTFCLPSICLSQKAIIQAVYTTDGDGKDRRVFKVGTPVKVHVVVRNISNSPIMIVSEDLAGEVTGTKSDIDTLFPEPDNEARVELDYLESHCFVFSFSDGFSPEWNTGGFPFVGDKMIITINGDTLWEFYVDEFGVPDWIRTANAVDLSAFGRNCTTPVDLAPEEGKKIEWPNYELTPFKLYDPSFHNNLLDDLAEAKVDVVFISAEYYNYGVLEGGTRFFDCNCLAKGNEYYDLKKCRHIQEPHMHYWFPTGPPGMEQEFNYLTPPLWLGAQIEEPKDYRDLIEGKPVLSMDQRRERIKNFVSVAHKKGREIKVIAYVDFWGIYHPDDKVAKYEYSRFLEKSGTTLSEEQIKDPSWVRLHDESVVRVKFVDNELGVEPLRSIKGRELNPFNYAISPSLYPANKPYASPTQMERPREPLKSSYRDFISSQLGLLVSQSFYDFDGVFCDDVGRLAQRPCNISFPVEDGAEPCMMYTSCMTELYGNCSREVQDRFNALLYLGLIGSYLITNSCIPICTDERWYEYLVGCEPNESWYAGDFYESGFAEDLEGEQRNEHIKGATGEFLRYCRHKIKNWGGKDKVLISSDYYVPWDEVVACQDASSTDLYDILTKYQAQWCDSTYGKQFKGMRLDFNPRCNTSSIDIQLSQVAISWANRCFFWFGGDKNGVDLNSILEETGKGEKGKKSFSTSRFGDYTRFNATWKDTLVNPLLETKYHSITKKDKEELKYSVTNGPADLYLVMYSKPCTFGEEYRLLHVISTQGSEVQSAIFEIPIPVGEEVVSVKHLSPGFSEKHRPERNELIDFELIDDSNIKRGLYRRIRFQLKNIDIYSVALVEFGDIRKSWLYIKSTDPRDDQLNVPCHTDISATFDKSIDFKTINDRSFIVKDGKKRVRGEFLYVDDNRRVIFHPKDQLSENSPCTVWVTTNVKSETGKQMKKDSSWSFLTGFTRREGTNYSLYAAQSIMWSAIGGNAVKGFWTMGLATRNNWGVGWNWADLNPREQGGSSLNFQSTYLGYRFAIGVPILGGMTDLPPGPGEVNWYLLAGINRVNIDNKEYLYWDRTGNNFFIQHEKPFRKELYRPHLGIGTLFIGEESIIHSNVYFVPMKGGHWGFEIQSYSGYGLAPYVDLVLTTFFLDYPKWTYGGIGLGLQVGF